MIYKLTKQFCSFLLQAMKCQLVTAVGAICGTLVSLTFGKDSKFLQPHVYFKLAFG